MSSAVSFKFVRILSRKEGEDRKDVEKVKLAGNVELQYSEEK